MTGSLFVVATPIGNLQDITLRAVETLKAVARIACEDTRVTRKLLTHYDIDTPTVAYHAHSDPAVVADLVRRLVAGDDVALVSDAGTPLVSDPGADLVAAALEQGVAVIPVPGPSALLAALMASGLPAQPVVFLGFVPRSDRDRREVLGPLRDAPYTVVLYEAANRVPELLKALQRSLGDRPACIARELTKRFEAFRRGLLSALATSVAAEPLLGEVVVIVGPAARGTAEAAEDEMRAAAERWLAEGQAPAEVARALAGAFGVPKRAAYKLVVSLRNG